MNTFDDIKRIWQGSAPMEAAGPIDEQVRAVRAQAEALERGVFWRDVREVGAGCSCAVFFAAFAVFFDGPPRVGSSLTALSCVGVSLFILWTRVRARAWRREQGGSLRGDLQLELRLVRQQYWLLRNIAWWYLAPLAAGISALIVSVQMSAPEPNTTFLAIYVPVVVALLGVVWWWNRKAAREQFLPQQQTLERLLDELGKAE